MIKKFLLFILCIGLLPFFVYSANKVIGVSGFENGWNDCVTEKWMEPLRENGQFEKNGYKWAEATPLRDNGRKSMHDDIDLVCEKINMELKDPKYQDLTAIDLIGHSKGGVAIENFSALIANKDTPEYKELSQKYPELFERWNKQPMFIENVVPVCAPMDGTFQSVNSFVKSDALLAQVARAVAENTGNKYQFINEGMLALTKENGEIDYFKTWKPGPARKDYLLAKSDKVVPAESATKAGLGHSEFVKNSSGHSSPFDPNDPVKAEQLLAALTHDPYDKSDYNTLKIPLSTKLMDFAINAAIGAITTPSKISGSILTTIGKIVAAPFKWIGSGISSLFSKKSSDNKKETVSKKVEWSSLDEVDKIIFGESKE